MHKLILPVFCVTPLLLLSGGCLKNVAPSQTGVESYVAGAEQLDAGNKQQAIESLQRSITQNPNLITPRILLGGIYRGDSDYAHALTQYEALVRLDPYTASNHYYLGLCYQLVDRLNEAALSYRRALKLTPNDPEANMNLGLVNLTLGKMDEALRYTKRATEIDPKSATAWSNYAVTLDAAGQYPEAETAYRRSLELDSTQNVTVFNLATNLLLQNRAGDALPLFAQSVPKQDSALARKRWGDALAGAKKYDEAIKQYDTALKMNPRYFPAYNAIGTTFIAMYRAGYELEDPQRQSALAAWKKSLEINPTQPETQDLVKLWSKQPLLK